MKTLTFLVLCFATPAVHAQEADVSVRDGLAVQLGTGLKFGGLGAAIERKTLIGPSLALGYKL